MARTLRQSFAKTFERYKRINIKPIVTAHVVRLKVFRLKTEGEREPKEFFSGIKQLQ